MYSDAFVGAFESGYRLERAIEVALIGPVAGECGGDGDGVGGGEFCAEEGPGECCVPPEEAGGEDAACGGDDAVVVEGEVAVFVEAAPLRRGDGVGGDVVGGDDRPHGNGQGRPAWVAAGLVEHRELSHRQERVVRDPEFGGDGAAGGRF